MAQLDAEICRDQHVAQVADDHKSTAIPRESNAVELLLRYVCSRIYLAWLQRPVQELGLSQLWLDDSFRGALAQDLVDPLRSCLPVRYVHYGRDRLILNSSLDTGRGIQRHRPGDDHVTVAGQIGHALMQQLAGR